MDSQLDMFSKAPLPSEEKAIPRVALRQRPQSSALSDEDMARKRSCHVVRGLTVDG